MQISTTLTWPSTNWPTPVSAATQYTITQVYPTPLSIVATVGGSLTSASITYDDAAAYVFQVRPSSGTAPSLVYGPEVATYVVNYVPCRAYLRDKIRVALADRTDAGATLNWPDDELNRYIQEAISELNIRFPIDNEGDITLLPVAVDLHGNTVGVRSYTLPADYYKMKSVCYKTPDEKLQLYLKYKPFKPGETTATSYYGYPKLGIMLSPLAGRFYPGNYDLFNGQLVLDWDPAGDGDFLHIQYYAKRVLPVGDADILNLTAEDMELISLRVQMKCWLRVEGQDTLLSRWRSKEDGGKRDDMPTVKHSVVIKQLYNELVNDRRELRIRSFRVGRR